MLWYTRIAPATSIHYRRLPLGTRVSGTLELEVWFSFSHRKISNAPNENQMEIVHCYLSFAFVSLYSFSTYTKHKSRNVSFLDVHFLLRSPSNQINDPKLWDKKWNNVRIERKNTVYWDAEWKTENYNCKTRRLSARKKGNSDDAIKLWTQLLFTNTVPYVRRIVWILWLCSMFHVPFCRVSHLIAEPNCQWERI